MHRFGINRLASFGGRVALFRLFFSPFICRSSHKKKQKKHAGETPAGRKGKMPSPQRACYRFCDGPLAV
jgi:hypothetical protein